MIQYHTIPYNNNTIDYDTILYDTITYDNKTIVKEKDKDKQGNHMLDRPHPPTR